MKKNSLRKCLLRIVGSITPIMQLIKYLKFLSIQHFKIKLNNQNIVVLSNKARYFTNVNTIISLLSVFQVKQKQMLDRF